MPQIYGAADGSTSSVGVQLRTDFYNKKALIEAAKEMFFGQMADVTTMPKNMGKTIKCFHYLPMLDDANINDQGIDANAAFVANEVTITLTPKGVSSTGNGYVETFIVGTGTDAATALGSNTDGYVHATSGTDDVILAGAKWKAWQFLVNFHGLDGTTGTGTGDTYAKVIALPAVTAAWETPVIATAVPNTGNLYGSSKDVGTITAKLPALSETGGRVNRVGFKRIALEGTLDKFGFFDEYTQESLDFDTDEELEMHISREMVRGANEITEDALQIDLLNSAGILRFGGSATSTAELSGNLVASANTNPSVISYSDLMKMSIDLDDNRCPKNTTVITGSRMVDTKVINAARYLYIGNELLPMVRRMEDLFGNQAFIPVAQYGDAGTIAVGEVGTIDNFRIIVVPEMMHWEGVGAAPGTGTTANAGYRTGVAVGGTAEKYNAYPMLCIGSGSFTTVGFQTDGKTVKFSITHKKPGVETADRNDPYGELGFMSIKWYYGFMLLRPERIALAKCVAEW